MHPCSHTPSKLKIWVSYHPRYTTLAQQQESYHPNSIWHPGDTIQYPQPPSYHWVGTPCFWPLYVYKKPIPTSLPLTFTHSKHKCNKIQWNTISLIPNTSTVIHLIPHIFTKHLPLHFPLTNHATTHHQTPKPIVFKPYEAKLNVNNENQSQDHHHSPQNSPQHTGYHPTPMYIIHSCSIINASNPYHITTHHLTEHFQAKIHTNKPSIINTIHLSHHPLTQGLPTTHIP